MKGVNRWQGRIFYKNADSANGIKHSKNSQGIIKFCEYPKIIMG